MSGFYIFPARIRPFFAPALLYHRSITKGKEAAHMPHETFHYRSLDQVRETARALDAF